MATPAKFGGAPYALECRVVDVGNNWEGVKAIETQYNNRCGVHCINNMFQQKVIEACSRDELLDIDRVAKYIKTVNPGLFIYSCLEYPGMTESQGYYRHNEPEEILGIIINNIDKIFGFVEWTGGHYVSWVTRNNYWYRLESKVGGTVKANAITVCKFTIEDMILYITSLEAVSHFSLSGFCRLLIVATGPLIAPVTQGLAPVLPDRRPSAPVLPDRRPSAPVSAGPAYDEFMARSPPYMNPYPELDTGAGPAAAPMSSEAYANLIEDLQNRAVRGEDLTPEQLELVFSSPLSYTRKTSRKKRKTSPRRKKKKK